MKLAVLLGLVALCLASSCARSRGDDAAGSAGERAARQSDSEKPLLFFSYITTITGSFVTSGAIPAVDLALELINNRTDILPNHTLAYTSILDSKCSSEASLDSFMGQFRDNSQPTYISLRCCGCSTATVPVADISHYWNVPHITGVEGSIELNDRERFKGFFRTDATGEFTGPALAEITRMFGWMQMAVVTEGQSVFQSITDSLSSIFKSEKRILDTTATTSGDFFSGFPYHLIHNWERDYRIIFLNTGWVQAYNVLCEAYYLEWFPPKYVWITYTWYFQGWWAVDYGNSSCTPDIMRTMLKGALAINPVGNLLSDDRDTVTISGLTPAQYEQQYRSLFSEKEYENLTEFIISGPEFDATWAMALALHNASERVNTNNSQGCEHLSGELVQLEDFDYRNDKMGCILKESYQHVTFLGVTGEVVFNRNGSRDSNVYRIHQYHLLEDGNMARVPVAVVEILSTGNTFMYLGSFSPDAIWEGGVPYDGTAREVLHPNHTALIVIYSIVAVIGLVYTAVCFFFNLLFRKKKVVKLSSPNLNYLIIAGAALLYMSVFLYIFSATNKDDSLTQTLLCNFRQWMSSLGYTLCFAVILTKAWRVYYIFSNPTVIKKITPKDWFLFLMILLIVSVDLLIMLVGTAIPASRLNAELESDTQHPTSVEDDGTIASNLIFVCVNNRTVIWFAVSYAYKALLQLVAMLMAFHTRNIKIKALNDSKEIAVIIYINSIVLTLLAVVDFALYRYHDVYAALLSLALLVEAYVFLTLVFIPKMVNLARDPDGKKIMNTDLLQEGTTRETDDVTELKKQLSETKRMLQEARQVQVNMTTEDRL